MESQGPNHESEGAADKAERVRNYIEDMTAQLAQMALAQGDFALASALHAAIDAARRMKS